nr:hypothetical protein BaRGS_030748 [Batillaria attramentaria]
MTSGFLYCTISLDEFGQHVLEEDDEALGPVVVYRLQRAVSVDLVVPLCEEVDDWQELVLRLLPDIGGKNDVLLDVKEAEGAFILLYRPVQQPIILDMSNKEVLSRVSGAKLKVGDNFQGQLRGRLQVVVEIKRGALEDKVKRKVAKQHRKRHHKKAVFFVIVRPWAGWRECREIKAVVTSPAHVANALKPYLSDGYTLVQLSGHTLVPNPSTFKVSIVGDLIIEDGILRLQRTRCNSAVTFGKALVKGLQSMGWNEQCEWLFQQLSDWDGSKDKM